MTSAAAVLTAAQLSLSVSFERRWRWLDRVGTSLRFFQLVKMNGAKAKLYTRMKGDAVGDIGRSRR